MTLVLLSMRMDIGASDGRVSDAANSVRPLPLKGGGSGWGRTWCAFARSCVRRTPALSQIYQHHRLCIVGPLARPRRAGTDPFALSSATLRAITSRTTG